MKRITLFMIGLVLSLGNVFSQIGSERPQFSTDDEGPWYFIKVVGDDDLRRDRLITAMDDLSNSMVRAFNQPMDLDNDIVRESQLWRFEQVDEEAGTVKIFNKYYEMYLDHGMIGSKWMATLSDVPTTDWEIKDARYGNANQNLYNILATDPEELHPSSPSLHMGNNGFSLAVVFEGDTYGYSENSQFYFVEYAEGFTIDVAEVNFGYVPESFDGFEEDNVKLFTINELFGIVGDYEAIYDTRSGFSIDLEENTGKVYFYPIHGLGEYFTELTVRNTTASGNTVERTIEMKAIVLPDMPVITSPSIENSDQDKWYSIYMDKRTGYYMKDMGTDIKPEVYPGLDQNDPSQLWKFVPVAGVENIFKVVSGLGNQLKYQMDEIDTEDGVSEVGRFYTGMDSDHTFSFAVRTGDGAYTLQWNEYEEETNGELVPAVTYVNKPNSIDYFTQSNSLTDLGSSMKFIETGSADYVKTVFPEFSNSEDPEDWTWYYIRFYRVAVTQGYPNEAIFSDGANNMLSQKEVFDEEDPFFWWRLAGTWDSFKIVDWDGNEFGPTTNGDTYLNAPGEGSPYKLIPHVATNQWQMECRQDMDASIRYVNDYGGGHSMRVGGYYGEDGGAALFFTPISQWSWPVGIETPGSADEDPVVSSVYYTIQGVQLANKPTVPGIYIQKNTHTSKKVSAQTIYIVK